MNNDKVLQEAIESFIKGEYSIVKNRLVELEAKNGFLTEDQLSLLRTTDIRKDIRQLMKRPNMFLGDLFSINKCRSALIKELLVYGAMFISSNQNEEVNVTAIENAVSTYQMLQSDEWKNFKSVIAGNKNAITPNGIDISVIEILMGRGTNGEGGDKTSPDEKGYSAESNISLFSNIQPIKKNSFFKKEKLNYKPIFSTGATKDKYEKRPFDGDFLKKITELEALKELRSLLGGAAATEYYFRNYQFQILENTTSCSELKGKDPCFGPKKVGNTIRLFCKCVNTKCPNFATHRAFNGGGLPSEDEIAQYSLDDLSCVDTYGYEHFRLVSKPYKVLLNSGTDSNYDASETKKIERHLGFDFVDELLGNSSNVPVDIPETPPDEPSEPVVHISSSLGEVLNKFSTLVGAQDYVITNSPDKNIIVDAGPGTGKTYALIQKLNYMVSFLDVDPECILVLCFTNSAVDEIKMRLKAFVVNGGDRGLEKIDVRTFHSFSWWLITQANEIFTDEGWCQVRLSDLSYDSSIDTATRIMRQFGNRVVDGWEHFIVDEVQDLTNERASFVLSILEACKNNNCGFTVCGDFCQAIFDYSCKNKLYSKSSESFYLDLYSMMNKCASFVRFTENHRSTDEIIKVAQPLRNAILTDDTEIMASKVQTIIDLVENIEKYSSDFTKPELDKLRQGGKICLLSRSNGDTFRLSSELRKHNIHHTINVHDSSENYAEWISDVFTDYDKELISFDDFNSRYTGDIAADEAWKIIQETTCAHDNILNVRMILNSISTSKIDHPLFRTHNNSEVIVSNIHRSKGREYDSVIIDHNFAEGIAYPDKDIESEEYRVLYVALTRAKRSMYFSPFLKGKKFRKIEFFATKRTRFGSSSKKKISFLEFGTEKMSDYDIYNFMDVPFATISKVSIGDPIVLRKTIRNKRLDYQIILADSETFIGYLGGSDFLEDIKFYNHNEGEYYAEMPSEITELYVSGIHSNVMNSEDLNRFSQIKEKNKNGVWKWIEFSGIGHVKYDVY